MPARKPERKRAQAKRSFVALCARNIAPRPLPHPLTSARRARGRPQGGCGKKQESRGGWAKSPRPAPPRATGLRPLRRAGPARAALKRESKKRRSGAAAKRTRAAPTLRPESRGARPSKFGRLASPARLQIKPSANDKVCRSSGERSKTGRTARSAPRCAPAQGGPARRNRPPPF